MIDELKAVLESQIDEGVVAVRQQEVLKPFFEDKEAQLWEAFKDAPTVDKEGLFDIKLQSNALKGMESYFQGAIDTGKLAQKQLEERSKN